jgi:hypothetical protein
MHWRIFGLVGFIVLLSHHRGLAEEGLPSPPTPDVRVGTETTLTELRLPPHGLVEMAEQVRCCSESEMDDRTEPPSTLSMKERAPSLSLPLCPLPALTQKLLGPWLPRLTRHAPSVVSASKASGYPEPSPRAEKKFSPLRLDQVWRIAPAGARVQTADGMTVNGGVDLGLEVHAGSTKKDRATNAIKGTTRTQVSLLPVSALQQRFGQYLGTRGTDEGRGTAGTGQLRMVLATNGEYTLNPSTRDFTPKGEVVGSLSWRTPASDRFIRDPWRFVAFRWYPTVSCEGRSLLIQGENKTTANRAPLATLTGSIGGDLRLDFLSPLLAASGNYQYGQHLTDAQTKWERATVSWNYQLNARVSLGGSFTQSKRAPTQQPERAFKLEMGVMF